jgi:hypothetical protein
MINGSVRWPQGLARAEFSARTNSRRTSNPSPAAWNPQDFSGEFHGYTISNLVFGSDYTTIVIVSKNEAL